LLAGWGVPPPRDSKGRTRLSPSYIYDPERFGEAQVMVVKKPTYLRAVRFALEAGGGTLTDPLPLERPFGESLHKDLEE
jgi:hypothetical protein